MRPSPGTTGAPARPFTGWPPDFLDFGPLDHYPAVMRWGIALLAVLIAAAIPTLILVGAATLRGLAWLLVGGAALVLLIDLTDRIMEWVQARRWGRRR